MALSPIQEAGYAIWSIDGMGTPECQENGHVWQEKDSIRIKRMCARCGMIEFYPDY